MGNNGTLANGVEWRPGDGMFGGALFVDPGDALGYCEITTADMKTSTGTFLSWGKLADPQPNRTSYFVGHTGALTGGFNNRIQLYTETGDAQLDLGLGDAHARQTNILTMALETLLHLALTLDNGSYVLYLDAEDIGSGAYYGL